MLRQQNSSEQNQFEIWTVGEIIDVKVSLSAWFNCDYDFELMDLYFF